MKRPSKLYRYRPLDDALLDRELDALRQSYLFSPSFKAMNDPMEAFLDIGGPNDRFIDFWLKPTGKSVKDFYQILSKVVDGLALISFSESHNDLPLWAYYASNFSGMCLEFTTSELEIGDLQGEKLGQVSYALNAMPPLDWKVINSGGEEIKEAILARLTRKRVEWAHEKEWRFITGAVGPRHYIDDALSRVFLGPRVSTKHAQLICEALDRRPVEVLQGEVKGFQLNFHSIKPARPVDQCERIGKGKFNREEAFYPEHEIQSFLEVPIELLAKECRRISQRPNMDEILNVGISTVSKDQLYVLVAYKLRNGRTVYGKRYFDRQFCPISLHSAT